MDTFPIRNPREASVDPALPPAEDEPRDDLLAFTPVRVRYRTDGWTLEKQREYVEALADTGVAKWAAARVGMTEQSANRLRRRADARSFDSACEAAQRIGARRLCSLACERVIEGTVKKHYYRGEVVGEERVFDNRMLIAVLPRLAPLLAPTRESLAVERNWQAHLDALELGLPAPSAAPDRTEAEPEWHGTECWEDTDGTWWTEFPPPPGFDGEERGGWGDSDYCRTLSAAEQACLDADVETERVDERAEASARRDSYFGFVPDSRVSPEACASIASAEEGSPLPARREGLGAGRSMTCLPSAETHPPLTPPCVQGGGPVLPPEDMGGRTEAAPEPLSAATGCETSEIFEPSEGEAPLEYKSMTPPARGRPSSFRRTPEPRNTPRPRPCVRVGGSRIEPARPPASAPRTFRPPRAFPR